MSAHVFKATVKTYKATERAAMVFQTFHEHRKPVQWVTMFSGIIFEILI